MTHVEVELKLELDPADVAALLRSSRTRASEDESHHLVATYFDTPDRAVWQSGYSLRIRRDGRRRIQTVKASGEPAAGLFARGEWERAVCGDTPVLDAASDPLLQAIGQEAAARIAPVFVTDVKRRTSRFVFEGADLELSVDCGVVHAAERAAPIVELELELRAGDMRALFDFARQLDGHVPLRLAVHSKPERGYALLGGTAPGPAKAEPVPLTPATPAADALCTILRSCIRHYRLNESLLLRSDDSEAVHQARVALRRLRTALWVFRPLLRGDADVRLLDLELRRLASVLGEARNLDVLIARFGLRSSPVLVTARSRAYEHIRAELESARPRILMLDLLEWLSTGRWLNAPKDTDQMREPVLAFAARRLERGRHRLKRLTPALAERGRRRSHRVRIEAKKARYVAGFFTSLWASRRARVRLDKWLGKLECVQDRLGELNDLAVARRILKAHHLESTLSRAGHAASLRSEAREALETLIDAPGFWTQ